MTRYTIGIDYGTDSARIVKAQIWDTAGQERYRSVTKAYYKGAKGALLVYDITRRNTFDNVDNWLIDLKTNGDKDILIILIGNKSDLVENREVSVEDAKSKAEQYGIAFLETSAKNGDNINKAFNELIEQVYNANISMLQENEEVEENNENGINLVNKNEEENKKKGCC